MPEQADAGIGSRRSHRLELMLRTNGRPASPDYIDPANVTVQNISEDGLLLDTGLRLHVGECLRVDLHHAGSVVAEIVWASGRLFGCAFATKLTSADLAAARLQSTHSPQPKEPEEVQWAIPSEALGPKLKRLRSEKGLTLANIANRLGVSKPTVWAWEKGKAKPLPERYDAIADAFDVDVAEITDVAPESDTGMLIRDSRLQIAQAHGVEPEKVRIMIDL